MGTVPDEGVKDIDFWTVIIHKLQSAYFHKRIFLLVRLLKGYRNSPRSTLLALFYQCGGYYNDDPGVYTLLSTNMDGMKLRTSLVLLALVILFASCNRYITPYEAANGKAKCGRSIR